MKTVRALCATLFLVLLAGCASQPSRADLKLIDVDLQRFMGSWHVIANIPYWLENGKVATRDEYRLMSDGRIENVFVFRRGFDKPETRWNGVSTVLPDSGGSLWSVQFVWPLSTRLQVLEVSDDYRWAILASPDRSYAWIFHRDAQIDDALYLDLLRRMQARGVDPCAIRPVPQEPSDLDATPPTLPGCPSAA